MEISSVRFITACKFCLISIVFSLAMPAMVQAETFSSVISGSNDSSYSDPYFSSTEADIYLGTPGNMSNNSFFLFDNVTINQGSTINNASLNLTFLHSAGEGTVRVRIQAHDVGNATAPTSGAEFASKQTQLTTQYVDWEPSLAGSWGQVYTTPDLTNIIQAIINRPDWESGNSILIHIGNNNSDSWSNISFASGDFTGSEPKPQLTIDYVKINVPPTAGSDTYSTNTQTPLNVLSNDSDPDGDSLSISEVSTPSHGTAEISGSTILYTPNANYVGDDTFTYTISDGHGNSAVGTVLIHVLENPVYYAYSFSINRSQVPTLYYQDLSYRAHLGAVGSASVTINGEAIPSSYNSTTGDLVFTTQASGSGVITVKNPVDTSVFSLTKAALKDNKKFAWSHGMDDNTYLHNQINLLKSKNWRGSLFLITNTVSDTREEGWIVDKPLLQPLLEEGWNLGNHTWSHECYFDVTPSDSEVRAQILDGYNRIMEIVNSSSTPNHKVISFAAPCFASVYDSYINNMRATGEIDVLYNESQGPTLMIVDEQAANYSAGGKTAIAVNSNTTKIGRDTVIETDPSLATGMLDWMNTYSNSTKHYWYNTLTHGNQETNLATVVNHAYDTYGPGGTDVLWMVPSDEIYSYLLVRDTTSLSEPTLTQLSDGSGLTLSNVSVSEGSVGTVTVSWTSNRPASSQILYGPSSSLGSSSAVNTTQVTEHSQTLTDLVACTRYYYQVKSTDNYEAIGTSEVAHFTTSGCTGDATIQASAEQALSTESGGSIELLENDTPAVTLVVPPAYSETSSTFQLKKLEATATTTSTSVPTGLTTIGSHVYDLKALSSTTEVITTFATPLTLSMKYDSTQLNGIDETSLKIYRYDGTTWNSLTNCVVDTSTSTVTCETDHFSLFGLFGAATQPTPTPTTQPTLTITPTLNEAPTPTSVPTQQSTQSGSQSQSQPPRCELAAPQSAPNLYSATALGTDSVLLSFGPATDPVDHYVLEYGKEAGKYIWAATHIGTKEARSYVVEALQPNTRYFFRIRGGNGCATGDWSQEIAVKTHGLLSSNQLTITQAELEESSTSEIKPITNQEETKAAEYSVKVKVINSAAQPVTGAKVTLHSKVQTGTTNEEGIVEFKTVEPGSHRVIVEYQGYTGEQSLFISNSSPEVSLTLTVTPKSTDLAPYIFLAGGIFIFLITLIIIGKHFQTIRRKV